jgi:putative (di)nucleoside polyphosphate hydrolase
MRTNTVDRIYRANVAAFVLNENGEILCCQRSDNHEAWQIPQGGIDPGETPDDAAMRELLEEIGTNQVSLIAKLDEPISYDWPENLFYRGFHGQEQWYYLFRLAPQATICLDTHVEIEFISYQWLSISEFLPRVHGFKADAYRKALKKFSEIQSGTIKR